MDDLDLLRRFEPVLRFNRVELFLPADTDAYVRACSLWQRGADGDDIKLANAGELDLVDQQLHDVAGILLVEADPPVAKLVAGAVVVDEVFGIDHGDERVEPGEAREALSGLVGEGEGLGHRQGLGDAGALHEQVVEAVLAGQPGHLLEEILPQGAADAAVGHFDELLLGAGEPRRARAAGAAGHELSVDVHFAHVVDDHGHAAALAVGQHVVQERGLAGPEKAGQDGDGQAGIGGAAIGHGGAPDGGEIERPLAV